MPSKTSEKNKVANKELEQKISPILVINNSSLRPFVELFQYSPENIYQQPLGTLVGFFEVQEYSDNSAYIVNFLTSVLKKEYYANPKRSIEESFDASMHKVNLALSELAKHGNIEWLGKLNASICVLEKSGAHFSVSGNARMFLWRAGSLTDISEGLASEESSMHPLKTFINVSSGRLEKNDKLFITSDDLFKIMTENELVKNLQRLEGGKFVQFLKTACSNQLEMIASIVVDIQEEVPAEIRPATIGSKKKKSTENVFSQAAFEDSEKTIAEKITSQETDDFTKNAEANDYTDKKTGHIYVQGENQPTENGGKTKIYLELAKENISSLWYHTKNITRRRFVLYKKRIAKSLEEGRQKRELRKIELTEEKRIRDIARAKEQEELAILQEKERQEREALLEKESAQRSEELRIAEKLKAERKLEIEIIEEKPTETIIQQEEIIFSETPEIIKGSHELTFAEKLARAKQFQTPAQKEVLSQVETEVTVREIRYETAAKEFWVVALSHTKKFLNKLIALCLKYARKIKENIHQENVSAVGDENYSDAPVRQPVLAPHFYTIKEKYAKLDSKQKIGAIGALVLIFIIPMFIARWINSPKPLPAKTQQLADPSAVYANEKNIKLKTSDSVVLQDPTVVATLVTDSGVVAITKTAVITPLGSSSKSYPLPDGSGNAVRAAYMQGLDTIFILTDSGNVVSFAPSVQKYSSNNINLSGISYSSFIGTYLTYLYVLDQQSNQIYRFPRAEGGFGDKTIWLKTPATLTNASDMTIDDNIYVLQNNQVTKFTRGQAGAMTLEDSNTPVHFDHIYTTADSSSFYVIDTKNTRLVQYDKDTGVIIAQYYNTDLAGATSFSIDEQNKVAYVTTASGVISLSIQ